MSTSIEKKVYVVTGANRGLGLGLLQVLLARPYHTVIVTVRSEKATQDLLNEISRAEKGEGSTLHIAQFDFSTAIPPEKVQSVIAQFEIDHIDVLILNAGAAQSMRSAAQTTAEDLRMAFEVNTIAPLLVFQGLWPLLQKSPSKPKLIWISSSVGSIGDMEPVSGGAYGPSRAAQNWLTRALHLENRKDNLIAIALHPGWVKTRMGYFAADEWRSDPSDDLGPSIEVEQSVAKMLQVIDGASEEDSGKFINAVARSQDERVLPW
ncbi:aflatoxin biosynthesis ketoreductase nor-1 [Seiridium cupressi]